MKSPVFTAVLLACACGGTLAAAKTLPGQTFDSHLDGPQIEAEFGTQIAHVGDVNGDGFGDLLVGAPLFDNGVFIDAGAAYLFPGSANGYSITPLWQVFAQQGGAQYGATVAGLGDVNGDGLMDFAVGAPFLDNGQTDEGGVFIYFGAATPSISSTAFLEVNQASAFFGASLTGAGDMNGDGYADVVAGSPGFDNTGATNGGLAGLWFGSGGTAFENTRDVTFFSSQAGARLGTDVAGIGDFNADGFSDLLVGAPNYTAGQNLEGAAFLYLGGSTVNNGTDGHFQIDQATADFGRAVAAAGDVNGDEFADIVVGAPLFDDGQTDEGATWVYLGGAAVDLAFDFRITANQVGANLGLRVAGLGDTNGDGYSEIAAASPLFDGVAADTGLVQVYYGSANGTTANDARTFEGTESGAGLGGALSGGDADSNGFNELLVGSRKFNATGLLDAGRVSIAHGGPALPDTMVDLFVESNVAAAERGNAMATGDLNGDGHVDLAVAAARQDTPNLLAGTVTIHLGSPAGLAQAASATIAPNVTNALFGSSVAIGDLNGDGFGDLIVGARGDANGQATEGLVRIYFGGAGTFDTTADRTLEVNQAGAEFGASVAAVGDVNGDGVTDLVVGAPFYDNPITNEGAVFVYFGGALMHTEPDARMDVNQGSAFLGASVAGVGDLNGDGFADFGAGAIGFDVAGGNDGAVFVWFGGTTFDTTIDRQYNGNLVNGRMGFSIAGVGDVNGDGYDDFVAGANEQPQNATASGAAFLFHGGANPSVTRQATISVQQASAFYGQSVAAAGDVNADGFADFWVGARRFDAGQTGAGAIFLNLGGPGGVATPNALTLARTVANEEVGFSVASGDFDGDGDADVATGAPQISVGQTFEGGFIVFNHLGSGLPASAQGFSAMPLAPVDQWGKSQVAGTFIASMDVTSPAGRDKVRLELEACPSGAAWNAPACDRFVSDTWTDVGTLASTASAFAVATGLENDRLYHWRSRVQYAPVTSGTGGSVAPTGPAVGPWRRMHAEPGLGDVRVTDLLLRDGFE